MPTPAASDPYAVLGLRPGAADAEVRAAHRRLVQLHHPDHNGGSVESAHRFAAVQAAYTTILEQRRAQAPPAGASAGSEVDDRIAALERELQAQREVRARAQAAAREAEQAATPDASKPDANRPDAKRPDANRPDANKPRRPTPEELGYFSTEDSLSKILDDAERELAKRAREASRSPFAKRLADLFGGSDDEGSVS